MSPTLPQPTDSPTLSLAPTAFVPVPYVLSTPPTSSAWIIRGGYFEVRGSSVPAHITDLQVTNYGATRLQVYAKQGAATPYEETPCAWQLVAETAPGWYQAYWQKAFPVWNSEGFSPVFLEAGGTVSFHYVVIGTGGILAFYDSGRSFYANWVTAPALGPVGPAVLTNGPHGYADSPFKKRSSSTPYGIYGGVKLETARPGSTHQPTAAPTALYGSSVSLESPIQPLSLDEVKGLQFDVVNDSTEAAIVSQIDVRFAAAGSHHVEVWMREGSHQGSSSSGCNNHNNWCGAWTQLSTGYVTSAVSLYFCVSIPFG